MDKTRMPIHSRLTGSPLSNPLDSGLSAPSLPLLVTIGLLVLFVCSGFTSVAAGVLGLLLPVVGDHEESGLAARLLVKAVLFALAASGCAWLLLRKARHADGVPLERFRAPAVMRQSLIGLTVAMLLAAALVLPHLDRYPALQPDETHHLTVARNVAEHGIYGSGHPDKGFVILDNYDSVGPPLILPIAATLRLFGTTFEAGRAAMAVHFLLMCLALYGLFVPLFGGPAAATGLIVLLTSFGSVYLGRTLYGEVPALLYLTLCLLCWRGALNHPGRGALWGLASGTAFVLMLYCKSFLLVSLWAFLAVLIYDRLSFRRIRWNHVLFPALGGLLTGGCIWIGLHLYHESPAHPMVNALSVYQHNLMFGFASVGKTGRWLLDRPLDLAGAILGMLATLRLVFQRRYDPPVAVLVILTPLLTFWWVFFTTANVPRYMFYSCAIAAMFSGMLLWNAACALRRNTGHPAWKVAAVLAVCVLGGSILLRYPVYFRAVYTVDEMRNDRALAAFVQSLPKEDRIATTHWPLDKLMILLADRYVVDISHVPATASQYDVVIAYPPTDGQLRAPVLTHRTAGRMIGPYAIVFNRPGNL